MINGKTILAVIPARGGSKGVPRKNVRELNGKPLIAWTIQEARQSQYIDRLILSSDDDEIIQVAQEWGCEVPFKRPKELASDQTPGISPVLHAVQQCPDHDYVVLLQPTSPLRSVSDIDGCIQKCIAQGAPACVSVAESQHSPYWMYTLDSLNHMNPLIGNHAPVLRRQDSPSIYMLNGAVYVARTDWLIEHKTFVGQDTLGYPMTLERSIDIDSEIDLVIADYLLQHQIQG
jgi:CMP-N,N'-diacetyllegionaminic acid synthase